jgi:purine-binding chemotaxis protein CheW
MNCILLDMHGLKLAVPFDYVEGALQLESLSLRLDGPEWVLGRFGEEPAWTQVVDTARWLIPERYKPEYSKYAEVIILKGRRWAIACDELVKSIRVDTRQINWHQDKSHRSWLLGTYMPERCAILDIDQLLLEFEACSA